jgi:hypothetical protein
MRGEERFFGSPPRKDTGENYEKRLFNEKKFLPGAVTFQLAVFTPAATLRRL